MTIENTVLGYEQKGIYLGRIFHDHSMDSFEFVAASVLKKAS